MTPGPRVRLRQLLSRLFAVSGAIVLVAGVAAIVSYVHLLNDRDSALHRIDPANLLVTGLLANYLEEENGVRGYALTGQSLFLEPYDTGLAAAAAENRQLSGLLPAGSAAGRLHADVQQKAQAWQDQFARPLIEAISAGDRTAASDRLLTTGKNRFDDLRQSVGSLQAELASERSTAQSRLTTSLDQLAIVMILSLVVVLLTGGLIWWALRRLVLRPLAAVASDARVVAGGQLDHEVHLTGPAEVAELASDIEAMRWRIFAEMTTVKEAQEQLAAANAELARSNEDLEQFAYVASHDLQEPLRKVASFCQLLEQRYGGQLDERGKQYIYFAADGAKRMQVLINDLLAFSRIGRTTERFTEIGLTGCLDTAVRNLSAAVEATGATVTAPGPLPAVCGDETLLVALLQNLIGNAVKFHGEGAPEVRVESERQDGHWLVSVTDNGIGIEPRFAERIFVIFQRLHGRDAYSGTGIGLAMCRKIVEFHGGRIWLDTEYGPGTRFCFTLPVISTEETPNEPAPVAEPGNADRARTADATG